MIHLRDRVVKVIKTFPTKPQSKVLLVTPVDGRGKLCGLDQVVLKVDYLTATLVRCV